VERTSIAAHFSIVRHLPTISQFLIDKQFSQVIDVVIHSVEHCFIYGTIQVE
jgi:hypothetical protein